MNEWVGIDFGTTHCRTGIYRSGKYEVIRNFYEQNLIGQNLGLDEYFRRSKIAVPATQGLKQLIGNVRKSPENQKVVFDEVEKLFRSIFLNIEEYLESGAINGIITVPCYYHDRERSALILLAEKAGFNQIRLLDENVALALGLDLDSSTKKILVFSLGAGYFSCTILIQEGKNFRTMNSGSSNVLSGTFFDSVILKKIEESFNYPLRQLKTEDQFNLIRMAVKGKKELSDLSRNSIQLQIPTRTKFSGNPGTEIRNISVNRHEFEDNCRDFIGETVQLCLSTIHEAGLQSEDINLVLLSGGSTNISNLQQLVRATFNTEIKLTDSHAISRGAALFASTLPQPEIKVKKPADAVPEPAKVPVAPKVPEKTTDYASDWVKLFSDDLEEYHKLWLNEKYFESISKMEEIQQKIDKYISNLCHASGKKYMERKLFGEALELFVKGYNYDKSNSFLKGDLAQCYNVLIEDAYKRKDYRTTMNFLKDGLIIAPDVKNWRELQAYLRNNLKKLEKNKYWK
jgi:actin-like ATPase involved in cell morphogenesis/DNA-binding ferritin-like protein (Dps family)